MTVPAKRKSPQKKRRASTKRCDTLFSRLVRSRGGCEIRKMANCPVGNLQCAHGFSRRYRAVRWDERNAWSACAGCHMFFTHNPLAWDDWLRQTWGDDLYAELKAAALAGEKVDLEATQARLEARLAEAA